MQGSRYIEQIAMLKCLSSDCVDSRVANGIKKIGYREREEMEDKADDKPHWFEPLRF